MYTSDKIVKSSDMTISHVIMEYLQEHPVIEATVNNNFEIISDTND